MARAGRGMPRRAVTFGLASLAASPAWASTDPLAGEALYADLKAYSGLGDHRTGTPGDAHTTDWLTQALRQAGYQVEHQAFDYPVFDLKRSQLRVGDRTLSGFPVWTPCPTPTTGITAQLSTAGGPGTIMVVPLSYNSGAGLEVPSYGEPLHRAVATGAVAVVGITENPVGELMALNAPTKAERWAVPMLLVAGRQGPALLAAAAAGAAATMHIDGVEATRAAHNVVGRRPGRGKTLVLSTPKSGWLRCAGERGAGMAIWLGLARWLAATTDHNLMVVSTSGHEVGGYGGRLFADALAPRPADTKLWMHIGANVAAYDFALRDGVLTRLAAPPVRRGVACSHDLLAAAQQAFSGQPGYDTPTDIDVQRAPGEVALYQRLGYRPIVGVVGAHPLHHTPRDLPDVTAPILLEPVARGLQALLRSLPAA